jgi:RNA polymerase sigma factor (sigma-70 family)
VLKDASRQELMTAIQYVLKGTTYISPSISERIIEGYLNGKKKLKVESSLDKLTAREKQILKLIAEGYKNKEIADLLCISDKTVVKHRSNLMKKLDLHNVSALTAYAIRKDIIEQ